jgi:hypothetical protein
VARHAAAEEAAGDTTQSAGLPTTTAAPASAAPSVPPVPCAGAIGPLAETTFIGTATVDGQPATAVLAVDEDGDETIVVFAEPDCEPERHPFDP